MALDILLAHTGQRLETDPTSFANLDAFKTWVAKNGKIAPQDQITLTFQGKPVKFQGLSSEKEIFVYDRRIAQPSSSKSPKALQLAVPVAVKYTAPKPPDTISDHNNLQAWKDLFMARRSWALEVVDQCSTMADEAERRYNEMEVIIRGAQAAVENLRKHVKSIDLRNKELQEDAKSIREEQELAGGNWEVCGARLRSISTTGDMIKFITGQSPRKSNQKHTLEEFVDIGQLKAASNFVPKLVEHLRRGSTEIGKKVDAVYTEADLLSDKVMQALPDILQQSKAFNPSELMQDIEAIAKKVSSDYENVLGYTDTSKNIAQASRTALLHTKNFLPNLSKRSSEMDGILRSVTEIRNSLASESAEVLHRISVVASQVTEANTEFSVMELDQNANEAINLMAFVNGLPITYASFMAEAIRRREWNDKVRSDSSTLANEMATFQDEEAKRRRKWQKHTGSALWGDRPEHKVIGLEVNLLGDTEEWPQVSRQDLNDLLETLQSQDLNSSLATEVSKIISDLNNPTKQQSKRAKAFKAGSIHEAALGRSALLMRGDDELIRALQEEKLKVESKLKTAESRVRRLEDLLHRQTQVTRSAAGNVFQLQGNPSPEFQNSTNTMHSPRLNDDSRRSSVSSRRFSANQGGDEKAFQQKLLSLEAELIAERERSSGLEKEVSARKTSADDMKVKVEEAYSTKKDLMENLEAQKREFIDERKSLDDEIQRLKAKLEEMEDEMDRYLGSRENEKATVDERVRTVHDEFERFRKEAAAEAQKAQGQVDFLRNDAKLQRESNETIERQLQNLREENKDLLARAGRAESAVDEHLKALHEVHRQLLPGQPLPADSERLAEVIVGASGDLFAELESVKSDAAIARADRDASQTSITDLKLEIQATRKKLIDEEQETTQLRETLAEERARFVALEVELNDERNQLSVLRTKIADGETGSEALKTRLEEEEQKVTNISEDLASRLSHIGGLEEELRTVQDKYQSAQAKHEKLVSRFEGRTYRAKDLTQRVYAQNDRLCRLLERLSYSVTREGSSMVIQRVPKPDRTNANDSSDPGSTIRRSISGAAGRKAMVDSGDLDLLYWMQNDDCETESEKYDAYINAIGGFDVEQFCEVITKRVKDMEYTAKKYSKDARAYREKSHIAQKEAHEKIAFKNFKEGDLALFLPTRNQSTGAWAAFNVGAPHFFLREEQSHKLRTRDWLLARIHKIDPRVVDLSKSISEGQSRHLNHPDGGPFGDASHGGESFEDDNPFELSDGLRWYLIDAAEEKPGAPSTPGLSKSTVASTHIDATGSIRRSKKSSSSGVEGINKTLSKSLDSRRSSNNSKKSVPAPSTLLKTSTTPTDAQSLKGVATTQTQAGEGSDAQIVAPGRQEGTATPIEVVGKVLNPENNHNNNSKSNTASTGTSPTKKSMIWDSLWSLDLSLESGKHRK